MSRQRIELRWIIGLLSASLVVGCAPLKLPKKLALPTNSDKPQVPQRITALWTDTVLVEAGIVGFGGRVMFYGRNDEDPIVVAGELTVFAYDDTDSAGANSAPARKFVFRSEELSKHYSKSSLGHSYSFWLPWGPVGGPKRQISLVTRFKSDAGGVAMSEMTHHFLPVRKTSRCRQPRFREKLFRRCALGRDTPGSVCRAALGAARGKAVDDDVHLHADPRPKRIGGTSRFGELAKRRRHRRGCGRAG